MKVYIDFEAIDNLIVEVGCLKVDEQGEVHTYEAFCQPHEQIETMPEALVDILKYDLPFYKQQGRPFADVYEELATFIGDESIAVWGNQDDLFLLNTCEAFQVEDVFGLASRIVDVSKEVQQLYKMPQRLPQSKLAEVLNVPNQGDEHTALADVWTLYYVYQKVQQTAVQTDVVMEATTIGLRKQVILQLDEEQVVLFDRTITQQERNLGRLKSVLKDAEPYIKDFKTSQMYQRFKQHYRELERIRREEIKRLEQEKLDKQIHLEYMQDHQEQQGEEESLLALKLKALLGK